MAFAPATGPPMVLSELKMVMPSPPLARSFVPDKSVPMELPWMRLLPLSDWPEMEIPTPTLDEITLPAPGAVPPMVLSTVVMSSPSPPLPSGAPAGVVPIRLPCTRFLPPTP